MKKGDAPTIQSNFYILGGEVEVWMKAAEGKGVVSCMCGLHPLHLHNVSTSARLI